MTISCGRRPPVFLGEPLPSECRKRSDTARSQRCLGWFLDRAFIARTSRYQQPALERYVTQVGQRLASATERPDLDWTFRLLDSPDVQAYALVGGYVYISRGTLAVLDSEAELASLLSHEMAHVIAGHSEDTILSLVDATAEYDQLFADYFERERDEERHADELAARTMHRAGYDARAMLDMLEHIHRDQSEASAGADSRAEDGAERVAEREGDWRRTHPPRAVRQARVALVIADFASGTLARERYLQALDGLVIGRDPRSGYLAGQTYTHVKTGISWQLPDAWQMTFDGDNVRALTERGSVTLFATVMPIGLGHYHFLREGLAERRSVRVASWKMVVGWLTPDASSALSVDTEVDEVRHLRAGLLAIEDNHVLILVAGPERRPVADAFAEVTRNFRESTAGEVRAARPRRIAIERAPHASTVAELAAALCPQHQALSVALEGGDGRAPRAKDALFRCVRTRP